MAMLVITNQYTLWCTNILPWKDPPFYSWENPLQMAIFTCYVSSPKGIIRFPEELPHPLGIPWPAGRSPLGATAAGHPWRAPPASVAPVGRPGPRSPDDSPGPGRGRTCHPLILESFRESYSNRWFT